MMPLPRGLRAFLRRLGILTVERDERALRFWSSRPIVCVGCGETWGFSVWCCNFQVSAIAASMESLAVSCDSKISGDGPDKRNFSGVEGLSVRYAASCQAAGHAQAHSLIPSQVPGFQCSSHFWLNFEPSLCPSSRHYSIPMPNFSTSDSAFRSGHIRYFSNPFYLPVLWSLDLSHGFPKFVGRLVSPETRGAVPRYSYPYKPPHQST